MCLNCWLANNWFLGFAVLDPIYGNSVTTNLVIGIVSIVVNAITIPIGLALINKGQAEQRAANQDYQEQSDQKKTLGMDANSLAKVSQNTPITDDEAAILKETGINREIDLIRAEYHRHAQQSKLNNSIGESIWNAVKQPVAAAPLLAVILVLIGFHMPASWAPSFSLIAKANSGWQFWLLDWHYQRLNSRLIKKLYGTHSIG